MLPTVVLRWRVTLIISYRFVFVVCHFVRDASLLPNASIACKGTFWAQLVHVYKLVQIGTLVMPLREYVYHVLMTVLLA